MASNENVVGRLPKVCRRKFVSGAGADYGQLVGPSSSRPTVVVDRDISVRADSQPQKKPRT